MTEIRLETPEDFDDIRRVNDLAFGQTAEGEIVDRLRQNCDGVLSLVAVEQRRVVGHIFFSPVSLDAGKVSAQGMGLAPMAVLPDHQQQGIGTRLVETGIEHIRKINCPFLIVLGHETYYPRFGFRPASTYGLKCQWDGVPDSAFMALIIDPMASSGLTGVVRYRDEFNAAM